MGLNVAVCGEKSGRSGSSDPPETREKGLVARYGGLRSISFKSTPDPRNTGAAFLRTPVPEA